MSKMLKEMGLINRCGGAYRTNRLPCDTLPAFQHNFLIAVCEHPGFSQDQLARHLFLNKSTVTRRITYLEENGYVTRVPSESDKRVMLVYPTERALALLPRINELIDEWGDVLTEGIDPAELAVFQSVLSRLSCRAKALSGMEGDNE